MVATPLQSQQNDDPRRLREQIDKAASLAWDHELKSVVVGMAGFEGDLLFPEIVNFVESCLRVDDAIVRVTRERAVVFLADVDRTRAVDIMERVMSDFAANFTTTAEPRVAMGYFEVSPETQDVSVKGILPLVFEGSNSTH